MAKKPDNILSMADDEFDEAFATDEKPSTPVHDDDADTIVTPDLVNKRPGMLRTRGELVLHTRSAHRLFYGRRRDDKKNQKPIIGLIRFALNMSQICDLAAEDDPYADAVLLKVENKLEECKSKVMQHVKELEDLLSDTDGISIKVYDSVEPVILPLEFKTTYGFLAARILSQYDKLVRLAQSARHVGLFFQEDWARVVRSTGSSIRNVFFLSTSYRYTGVRRDDIAANNKVARRAIDKYGELPPIILKGTKRARYAPAIGSRPETKH
ncbi:MAG: PFL_4669 family integrating conjugative element protein [Candidatus Thiodiazotropha endolucinida]